MNNQTKYKKFYQLMEEQNATLFDRFQAIHDVFAADKSKEAQFHQVGREVMDVMRMWERKLCQGMERGNNGMYSQKLADKFWEEIKKRFPQIELVGLITKKGT